MKVRFTKRARTDLQAIFRYVAADDPNAAGRLVDEIENLIARLGPSLALAGRRVAPVDTS